jgi:hypothetical protein
VDWVKFLTVKRRERTGDRRVKHSGISHPKEPAGLGDDDLVDFVDAHEQVSNLVRALINLRFRHC